MIRFAALAMAGATLMAQQPAASEVRAMWVQRTSLTSPASIRAAVDAVATAGFNTLIVQVRGRGDAYYASRYEPRAAALSSQPPSFDPLETTIAAARRAGLSVHAWVNVNLVSDAEPPSSRQHIVRAHPEWLMVPRSLVAELRGVKPQNARYVRRLSQYARDHRTRVEGLFLSPIHSGAADHAVRIVDDLVGRYDIDGIHLDYIRFPNEEFDYSPAALDEFRSQLSARMTAVERRQYAERARGRPLFYTEMFPLQWQEFRRARLTSLLVRLRTAVKTRRPAAMLTAAVFPDANDAASRRFQDWGGWLSARLLDAICPMAYTTDPAVFRTQIATVERLAAGTPVWAGIGAYQLTPAATVENVRAARELGVEGIILFSYNNLNASYLDTVAAGAFR